MPVIKGDGTAEAQRERAGAAQPVRTGAVVDAEVYASRQAAQAILAEARRQAEALLEEARGARERLVAEAREAGRQEGLAQATEVLLRARLQARRAVEGAEADLVTLACRVAERLIGRELERDPAVVVDLCAHALSGLRQVRQLVLHVHPEDAALLRAHRQRFLEVLGRTAEVAVKEDAEVRRGGCVVHTEAGTIDAQLDTQLEVLQRVLLGEGAHGGG